MAAVECVTSIMKTVAAGSSLDEAGRMVERVVRDIQASGCEDQRIGALIQDLTGQVLESISRKEWYDKWGVHYLPSLCRAHLLQYCANFKDPGLQFYGGALFKALQNEADDIFVKMPPPTPSVVARPATAGVRRGATHGPTRTRAAAPLQSMSAYHNCSGGCFRGDCIVAMADGTAKTVATVRKGDMVEVPGGHPGGQAVLGVMQTHFASGPCPDPIPSSNS